MRQTFLHLSETWMRLADELETALGPVTLRSTMNLNSDPGDDKLLTLIQRYDADMKEIHAFPAISDNVLDAMMDKSVERLTQVIGVPSLTAASALAALDLLREELIDVPEDPNEATDLERCLGALMGAVRGYIASTATK